MGFPKTNWTPLPSPSSSMQPVISNNVFIFPPLPFQILSVLDHRLGLTNAAIVHSLIWKGEGVTCIPKADPVPVGHRRRGRRTLPESLSRRRSSLRSHSLVMRVTQTTWLCTQIRGGGGMVWLMVPNKDRPRRKEGCLWIPGREVGGREVDLGRSLKHGSEAGFLLLKRFKTIF